MASSAEQRVHVVTVNNDAAEAKDVIGKLKEAVKEKHHLVHVANCESIMVVKHVLTSLVTQPKVLICSSKLFEDEQEEVRETTKRILPDIKLIMLPNDVTLKGGESETIEYLVDQVTSSHLPTRA